MSLDRRGILPKIVIEEPVPHRIFQRNSDDRADISFSLVVMEAFQGKVEIRISDSSWQTVGRVNQSLERFKDKIESVAVGQHFVEARIIHEQTGEVLEETRIDPIFVGDLWLLAGQSNMEGCGKLIDCEQPQSGVSCFYFGDRWDIAVDPLSWQLESDDPVHWGDTADRQKAIRDHREHRVNGSGLGLAFGKHLLRETGVPIGLIMVAHGGTSMTQWDPGLADQGGRSLYGSMLRIIQVVGGKVKGCLWYQGESDATSADSPHYFERFRNFVQSLRLDAMDSALPFIYAQLAPVFITLGTLPDWPEESQWNKIQHEQLRMESELERIRLVPAIDAKLDDFIHVSTESLREIGRRMAWAAMEIAYGRPMVRSGPRLLGTSWNRARTELLLDLAGVNGALRPVDKVFGFRLTSEGAPVPFEACVSDDRSQIVLRFRAPAPENCELCHGSGLNPVINARDELGIPLVVFGPILV